MVKEILCVLHFQSAEEWVVFLFRKGGVNNSLRRRKLPQMLQCIVKEPRTLLPFNVSGYVQFVS